MYGRPDWIEETATMPFYISPPPRNPVSSILAGVLGALLFVGAFMLGFVVLLVVGGLGLLVWLGVLVRIKWAQHQLRKQGFDPSADLGASAGTRPVNDDSLEAEYTVISKERKD